MQAVTPEHIAGLVVGEGCFYVESAPDPKYKSGWRIRPAFCIEMRADDRDALEAVQQHPGCGRIYELDFGRYRRYRSKGWRPHAKYRVTRLQDLNEKVIPFFKRHRLFGRKRISFEIFAELVPLLTAGEHRTGEGLLRAKRLASALGDHNKRG